MSVQLYRGQFSVDQESRCGVLDHGLVTPDEEMTCLIHAFKIMMQAHEAFLIYVSQV